MRKKLMVFCLAVASAATALALPVMPSGFRCIFRDDSGKTWRETGEFALSPDAALAALRKAMLAQGYAERFDISGGNWSSEHVLLWIKGDEEIIISLWKKGDSLTGCSWGLSAKTPPASGLPSGGGNFNQPKQQATTKENSNGK